MVVTSTRMQDWWRAVRTQALPTPESPGISGFHDAVICLSVSGDGRKALSAGFGGELLLWDIEAGTLLKSLPTALSAVRSVSLNWNGSLAFVADGNGTARLWDLDRETVKQVFSQENDPAFRVAFSPDDRLLATATETGDILIHSVLLAEPLRRLSGHKGPVSALAWTNWNELLSAGWDKTVRLWPADGNGMSHVFAGHRREVHAIAITPDGRRAVSGGREGILRVWDVSSRRALGILANCKTPVTSIAIADNGRLVVSGANDGSIQVRSLSSGQDRGRIKGHVAPVTGLSACPGGRSILSCGADGVIQLTDLQELKPVHCLQGGGREQRAETVQAVLPEGNAARRRYAALGSIERLFLRWCDRKNLLPLKALQRSAPVLRLLCRPPLFNLPLPAALLKKASHILHGMKDETNALILLEKLLARYPADPMHWLAYSKVTQELDLLPASLAACDRAKRLIEEQERSIRGQATNLLIYLAREGQPYYGPALEESRRAQQLQPLDINTLHQTMEILAAQGDFAAVARLLDSPDYQLATLLYNGPLSYGEMLRWLLARKADPLRHLAPVPAATDIYHIAIVVWGDAYLQTMETVTLPSLLASGNLPALAQAGSVRLTFLAPEQEAERLETMPVMAEIRRYVTVSHIPFPKSFTSYPYKYKLMSVLHVAALDATRAENAHFVFIAPDIILSDNFLSTLERRRSAGKGIIMVAGIMLEKADFLADLDFRPSSPNQPLSVAPSELLKIGIRHLNWASQHNLHAAQMKRDSASVILWPLRGTGFVAHGFQHTPYLISREVLQRYDGSLFNFIDADFLSRVVRTSDDLEDCDLIQNALETNYFELSSTERPEFLADFDMYRVARWGAIQGFAARWLFPRKIYFDPDGPELRNEEPAYEASDRFVAEVMYHLPESQWVVPLPRTVQAVPPVGALSKANA